MIFLLLSFITPLLVGVLLTLTLPSFKENNTAGFLFKFCLGTGFGIGITSCFYFINLLINPSGHSYFMIEAALMLLSAAAIYLLFKKGYPEKEHGIFSGICTKFKLYPLFPLFFYGALFSSIVSIVISYLKEPHGKWDAFLIWNMHARFINRGGEHWRDFFSSGLDWSHLDYPLLIPLSVARGWKYMGNESQYMPMVLSGIFIFVSIGLISSSLSILKSRSQGYLSGLVLMGSPFFVVLGASQMADIPLAFFLLATLALFFLHDRLSGDHHSVLILAGVAAGLAAWTKNEGLLFLVIVFMTRLIVVAYNKGWKISVKQMSWFITGVLPVLIIIIYFKIQLAPPGDLFGGQTLQQILDKLFDFQRYYQILSAYALVGISFTQGVINIRTGIRFDPGVANIVLLTVYVLLTGIKMDHRDKFNLLNGFAILLLILVGYFFVYVITPHDLTWHLPTSLNRLYIQLWPSIVFLCFIMACTPEQAFSKDEGGRGKYGSSSKASTRVPSKKKH